jgi:hypothetical protein
MEIEMSEKSSTEPKKTPPPAISLKEKLTARSKIHISKR